MENKAEKKGSSKIKIIAIGILILAVVAGGAFFGYNNFIKDKKITAKNAVQTVQQVNTQQVVSNGQTTGPVVNSLDQVVSSQTFQLDEVTVNLADEGGNRYLKAAVYLGFNEKKLNSELTAKKPIVTDAVIQILRTKKAADISAKNMNNIKLEIIQKINPMLEKGQLNNVYFTDIVIQ
ncbi:flagellar basal body-associated FliL family protein [Clostridium sp. AWRP]|uniref:flagellar basal body-associated FliL family protein n=1 Tax=Clostridium sp. AWRP TaxID=2212991 RepID=UPI000FDA20A5|nr:flagellar basal body-associated FliL family protein [Clostridium sp. AWRP]AZV55970.1 flagellar basal body protein FliL [Clostridium sp. AWRP]